MRLDLRKVCLKVLIASVDAVKTVLDAIKSRLDDIFTHLTTGTTKVNLVSSVEIEVKNDTGNPLPVSGTVSIGNFPSSQNVVVTNEVEIKNDTGNPIDSIDNYYKDVISDKVFSFSGPILATGAGADNPVFLLVNPNGSGKNISINELIFGDNITNNLILVKIFANPTVTANGTLANVRNNYIGSVVTSIANAYTLPTISANGNELRTFINGRDTNSIISDEKGAIVLPPNNALLITSRPSNNNRIVNLTLIWREINV